MLKAVSSISNAIGALNYKGTWNANTNTPTLVSGAGTKGDYYVVSVAGTTTLDGISNWGIGDWAVFNGSAWQRVEGGADLNGVNLSVTGTSTLDGNVIFKDNLTQNTAGKGINFSANSNSPGMTSELLNWYEEGTWTPSLAFGGASTGITYNAQAGTYTRIGRLVHCFARLSLSSKGSASGSATIGGLPFTSASGDASLGGNMYPSLYAGMANITGLNGYVGSSSTTINLGNDGTTETGSVNATHFTNSTTIYFSVQYYV